MGSNLVDKIIDSLSLASSELHKAHSSDLSAIDLIRVVRWSQAIQSDAIGKFNRLSNTELNTSRMERAVAKIGGVK